MQVRFLGQEDPLKKGTATHLSILGLENPMNREAWQATVHGGHKESDTTEATWHTCTGQGPGSSSRDTCNSIFELFYRTKKPRVKDVSILHFREGHSLIASRSSSGKHLRPQ